MYLLGYDLGSSSVKAVLLEVKSGRAVASTYYPKEEMPIFAKQEGWAEQNPEMWWENVQKVTQKLFSQISINREDIKGIGISYQMHGLVVVDKNLEVLRPSIIWCDSRATEIGDRAFQELGEKYCLENLLNSPGNFTASKLAWVKNKEPALFEKIYKFMLPGDFIAMKMTGSVNTTISGLSEGIFWDFQKREMSQPLMDYFGFSNDLIPETVPTFGVQGELSESAAEVLKLKKGTPICYRAGDQPNNAFSLNVLNPGEVAATAGTSGVVYSVSNQIEYDPLSRVNTFAHVNHGEQTRLGVLLCVNGCGIQNAWLRRIFGKSLSYVEMNELATQVPIGSENLIVLPFGNGAERLLQNRNINANIDGLNFNIHDQGHLIRAAQEGIAFAIFYGMEVMQNMGINLSVIKASKGNLFLSPIFRKTLAAVSGSKIELFNTDGAIGAARGAGLGNGVYASEKEAFESLEIVDQVVPNNLNPTAVKVAYERWKEVLNKNL
jgi:xylulokinase